LASVPLLLTLLCIAFNESMNFPKHRAELYKDAIDALLKKWDASRSIQRAEIYKGLSLKHKETMLSRIAAETFEQGKYFLPQRTLEAHIARFIGNLPEVKPQNAAPDSAVVLKMIEAQHGLFTERARNIYSFSHLTFQEYFTARYIVHNVAQGALTKLAENHLTDDRWREVFLLTAGLLPQADDLIHAMKKSTNALLNWEIANWLDRLFNNIKLKAQFIEIKNDILGDEFIPSPSQWARMGDFVVRARSLDRALELARNHDRDIFRSLDSFFRQRDLDPARARVRVLELAQVHALARDRVLTRAIDLDSIFQQPNINVLNDYLLGWLRIVECLTKSGCYVSKETREKILSEVLLPPSVADQTPEVESH
jgi:hypothetical protein